MKGKTAKYLLLEKTCNNCEDYDPAGYYSKGIPECMRDNHTIEDPSKETCDKWVYSWIDELYAGEIGRKND